MISNKCKKLCISITWLMNISMFILLSACGGGKEAQVGGGALIKSASGVLNKIYADSPSLSGIPQLPIIGEMGKSAGSADCSFVDNTLVKVSETSGKTDYQFRTISVMQESPCWAGVYWNFKTPYTNTKTSLRFSVKSTNGGVAFIKAKLETAGVGGARESEEISKSFPADNKWHELIFPIPNFSAHSTNWRGSNYNLAQGIYTIVIALDDMDEKFDSGIKKQSISIDEVLFVK